MIRFRCPRCGADLPPWFDPAKTIYDTKKEDEAFERWMDTACKACGRPPREVWGRIIPGAVPGEMDPKR